MKKKKMEKKKKERMKLDPGLIAPEFEGLSLEDCH